jgi:hypothetical protein
MPPQIVQTTYTVLTNKTLNNWPGPTQTALLYKLPEWFVTWPKTKIIKVYGCSFIFLESEPPIDGGLDDEYKPRVSTRYANQFISVHSNIVRNSTTPLHIHYETAEGFPEEFQGNLGDAVDYMMTANNFYNPKVFDLTNNNARHIKLWFQDSTGQPICLRGSISANGGFLNEVEQAVIRLECELAIIAPEGL